MKIQYGIAGFVIGIMSGLFIAFLEMKLMMAAGRYYHSICNWHNRYWLCGNGCGCWYKNGQAGRGISAKKSLTGWVLVDPVFLPLNISGKYPYATILFFIPAAAWLLHPVRTKCCISDRSLLSL